MKETEWSIRIAECEQLLLEANECVLSKRISSTTNNSNNNNSNNNNEQRKSAEARRKLTTFKAKLSELIKLVSSVSNNSNSTNRKQTIERLRRKGEEIVSLIGGRGKNSNTSSPGVQNLQNEREEIEERERQNTNSNEDSNNKARTTMSADEATVLQFQRQIMREQDEDLDDLSKHVTKTKHIAVAVGEELDLHTRLLDDFDDEVEHTAGKLSRISTSARRLFERLGESNFSSACCLGILILMLVVVIVLSILKVEHKFNPHRIV